MLGKMDLSDIVLLLGAGGVIAYLWRSSMKEYTCESHESRLTETSLMSWLFDKPILLGESSNTIQSNRLFNVQNVQDDPFKRNSKEAKTTGLNALS